MGRGSLFRASCKGFAVPRRWHELGCPRSALFSGVRFERRHAVNIRCPQCGIERETLDSPCLICGFKPDPKKYASQAGASHYAAPTSGTSIAPPVENKRPITHVVWFSLVILSLAEGVFQRTGDTVLAFTKAGAAYTYGPVIPCLYVIAAVVSAHVGYKLLPRTGYLTLCKAILWSIYAGAMFNAFHLVTLAYIAQGVCTVDWAEDVARCVLAYGSLGLLALGIRAFQTAKTHSSVRSFTPGTDTKFVTKHGRTVAGFLAVSVLVAASLAFAFKPRDRYILVTDSEGRTLRIDKDTGKIWRMHGSRMVEIEERETPKAEPKEILKALPLEEREKIEGNAGIATTLDSISGTIYNGSTWSVKELTLSVTGITADGSEAWKRVFNVVFYAPVSATVAPLGVGKFIFEVGDRFVLGWNSQTSEYMHNLWVANNAKALVRFNWTIDEVRGTPAK